MAAKSVDHISSIKCIIERISSDISNKAAFTPPGHIKRQKCNSKEAYFGRFLVFASYRTWCINYKIFFGGSLASCTLDFKTGNFTCILRMKSFEDFSFKSLLLQEKEYSMAVIQCRGNWRA